jgi:hypothetical protein
VTEDMIRVRPLPASRIDFARWAVAQVPKLRTINPYEFAVPPEVFAGMPEDLLIGATVDGHPYVSPTQDTATGTPPPGAEGGDLLGVATAGGFTPSTDHAAGESPETADPATLRHAMDSALAAAEVAALTAAVREATPSDVLPEVPASEYGPDSVALDEAGSDLPAPDDSDPSDPRPDTPEGVYPCPHCEREFTTSRGRRAHRRQAHTDIPRETRDAR